MKLTNAFYLICISLCVIFSTNQLKAQDSIPEPPNQLYTADSIMASGDFELAAIAYEHLFFNSTDRQLKLEANLKKAEALKAVGKFDQAANDLGRSLIGQRDKENLLKILYQMALCRFLNTDYPGARSEMLQLLAYAGNTPLNNDCYMLFSLIESMNKKPEEALKYSILFVDNIDAKPDCKASMHDEITNLFSSSYPRFCNPDKASRLSTFLPGTGQMYTGYPWWGILNGGIQLSSLTVAALLIFNHYYFSAFVLGFGTFQMFYFGGIKHAHELAIKKNKKSENMFLLKLTNMLTEYQNTPCGSI